MKHLVLFGPLGIRTFLGTALRDGGRLEKAHFQARGINQSKSDEGHWWGLTYLQVPLHFFWDNTSPFLSVMTCTERHMPVNCSDSPLDSNWRLNTSALPTEASPACQCVLQRTSQWISEFTEPWVVKPQCSTEPFSGEENLEETCLLGLGLLQSFCDRSSFLLNVSLCNPGWPPILHPPVSTSQMLGSQVCIYTLFQ